MTGALVSDPAVLDAAARRLGLRFVVAFGSRATGTPPPEPQSDLDLLVWAGPGRPAPALLAVADALADAFPDVNLDVAALDGADPLFACEALGAGLLLWGDPDAFYEARAFAYRAATDSAGLRRVERALVRRTLDGLHRRLAGAS